VFFTNGGADANENAIKIAKWFTGRHKILARYRAYHGATAGNRPVLLLLSSASSFSLRFLSFSFFHFYFI